MEVSGQLYDPAALSTGKNPGIHRMGGRLGPRITLDILETRKNILSTLEFKSQTVQSVSSQVTAPIELCWQRPLIIRANLTLHRNENVQVFTTGLSHILAR